MIISLEKNRCSGCYSCAQKCPKDCVQMVSDQEGFWYPQINLQQCVSCGLCEKVCPVIHPISVKKDLLQLCYAAVNDDELIKERSSSGGVFTGLASLVLERKGVVFGAAFDANLGVTHKYAETLDELQALCGSKYVQSRIGNAYRECEQFLKEGRPVLFTGSPCQIGGLLSFLGKDYENLYTQDFICHGVPSPKVWNRYVQYRELRAASKTKSVCFRQKKYGWKMYSLQFIFENCKEYIQILTRDLYMRGFLADLFLRPSCYHCSFKNQAHVSDITLGDFWGIDKIDPEMFDNKGTSLVIVNTQKGKALFYGLNGVSYKKENLDLAVKYNPSLIKSVAMNPNREAFFQDLKTTDFKRLINRYVKISFLQKCKAFIKYILK